MTTFEESFIKLFLLEVEEDYSVFHLEKIVSEFNEGGEIDLTLYFRGRGSANHLCLYLWDFLQCPEVMCYDGNHYYCWVERPYIESHHRDEIIINIDGYYRKILGTLKNK